VFVQKKARELRSSGVPFEVEIGLVEQGNLFGQRRR